MSTTERLRTQLEQLESLHHLSSAALQSRATPETPHKLLTTNPPNNALQAHNLTEQLVSTIQTNASTLVQSLKQYKVTSTETPQSDFYTALRQLRELHRAGIAGSKEDLLVGVVYPEFSGEEDHGRCLDLLQFHRVFVNIPGVKRLDYVTFLRDLTKFEDIPASVRGSKQYELYLKGLFEYLDTFVKKTYPLESHILGDVLTESTRGIENVLAEIGGKYASAEALLTDLGMDGVKTRLLEIGLKCGGRGIDRAERLLTASRAGRYGRRAIYEGGIKQLLQALCEEHFATISNVERKLAQSFAEVAADREAGKMESSDEEEVIYNPKDIPLGWDGKPMPYWMYKLHGLNHVFKCEICGGASYRGPRAFERHFSEAVHVAGLRRLGIGYSKAFMMITGIDDALRLFRKLEKGHDHVVEVEFEDSEGNVMNERTWKDLKRQGLI